MPEMQTAMETKAAATLSYPRVPLLHLFDASGEVYCCSHARSHFDAAWRQPWRSQPNQNGGAARRLCIAKVRRSAHLRSERQRNLPEQAKKLARIGEEDPGCDRG